MSQLIPQQVASVGVGAVEQGARSPERSGASAGEIRLVDLDAQRAAGTAAEMR